MYIAPKLEVPNETFLSLALQADRQTELSNFGKAVTVMLCFLATAMEHGATQAEIDTIMGHLKAAVIETAARCIAETVHATDS